MSILAAAAIVLLVPMLGIAFVNLVAAPRLTSARPPRTTPRVSLLVPARDEEENLRLHLPSFALADYADLEVIVLDDGSSDGTRDVVRQWVAPGTDADPVPSGDPPSDVVPGEADGRAGADGTARDLPFERTSSVRLLRGAALRPGWVGKNWACHQLAAAASGEILIFCDADVEVHPRAITATVSAMERTNADVLSAFPRHRLADLATAAVVPLVTQLPVGMLLPLPLLGRIPTSSATVGNGQWLAFTRAAYDSVGGHEGVRAEVVEDVALARHARQAGLRVVPVLAPDLLTVRMYRTYREMRDGFEKNLYALAGGRPDRFAGSVAAFLLVFAYPLIGTALGHSGAAVALALLIAARVCGALTFRHDWRTVVLHPFGTALVLWIAARSFLAARRGRLRWKGRTIAVTDA